MRKIYFYIISLLLILCSVACNERFGKVMEMAGENRSNLVKVLEYFEDDSLKSKAAMFLIENMYHYTSNDSGKIYDIQHITADYLIKDINSAFDSWEQSAWKDEIDFETFCRYILPYRVNNESMSFWRDSLRDEYKHLIIGINDPIEAFAKVYSEVIRRFNKIGVEESKGLDIVSLHNILRGSCDQRSMYSVAVLRSLGIPAAYDYVPFWGNYSVNGHSWGAFVNKERTYTVYKNDTTAKEYNLIDGSNFNVKGELIHPYHKWDSIKRVSVINRKCYELQSDLEILNNNDLPNDFRNLYTRNVSDQYGYTLSVKMPNPVKGNAYLYVFNTGRGWRAVAKGISDGENAFFNKLPGNIVYQQMNYSNGKPEPVGHPFLLDTDGKTSTFTPDMAKKQTIILRRKYSLRIQWYNRWKMMLGSTIEVANDSSFRNKKTIYRFDTPPESIIEIPVNLEKPYRYIRIQTTTAERPEIAEFKVFSKGTKNKMSGDIIYFQVPDSTVGSIFDDNYLTYAQKAVHGYWVGLDFGENNNDTIGMVEFCPRHDMNMIRKGHKYELFYYDKEWKSLGEQIATADSLIYKDVPSNAILWLRNHSEGNEERIFTYENGMQVWR